MKAKKIICRVIWSVMMTIDLVMGIGFVISGFEYIVGNGYEGNILTIAFGALQLFLANGLAEIVTQKIKDW